MKQRSNTLLLTRHNGQVCSFEYQPQRALAIAVLAALTLSLAILYAGFHVGTEVEIDRQLAQIRSLQLQSDRQQQLIQQAHASAQDNLDALTLRLGRMQAQMLRLDVLGKRLVDAASLDSGEFDFSTTPAAGGPDPTLAQEDNSLADFLALLEGMYATVEDRSHKLVLLEQLLMYRNVNQRVTPSGKAVEHGLLSSKFGMRIDPFTGKRALHKGVDIAGKSGSEILAVGDGVVTYAGTRKGYGNLVELDHGNGYTTRYAHNQKHLVRTGETVRKGQPVALMGSTGRSTGPHVHLEVLHDGNQVNPEKYLSN